MATIILFHSILGLRPVEREIAKIFEADGHEVILPDLFEGRTVEDYDAGFALKDEIGEETIRDRARSALDQAPKANVLAGVSFGAFLIGDLWQNHLETAGALLFSGVAPWSPSLPPFSVSAHIARPDPFDDEDFFVEWAAKAGEVDLALHRYDGAGHYFLDKSLPDYDAQAARLCMERARAFLTNLS